MTAQKELRKCSVSIAGITFSLKTDESVEQFNAAVSSLDRIVTEITQKNPSLPFDHVCMMAALHLSLSLVRARTVVDEQTHTQQMLISKIEQLLTHS